MGFVSLYFTVYYGILRQKSHWCQVSKRYNHQSIHGSTPNIFCDICFGGSTHGTCHSILNLVLKKQHTTLGCSNVAPIRQSYISICNILRPCLFPAFPTCTCQYKIFNQSQAVKDGCNMSKDFFARLDSMISKNTSSTSRQSNCHFIGVNRWVVKKGDVDCGNQ